MGAARVREDQVESFGLRLRGKFQNFPGLSLPVAEHHLGQAIDDDVEETADEQTQNEGA
jgi:hypothetical protein